MKCTICGKPIVLIPSAKARAAADVSGKSAAYHRKLFRQHAECIIEKRERETLELMRRINGSQGELFNEDKT
mgnify:CR=1 FL=1